jgi:uncharacterized protein
VRQAPAIDAFGGGGFRIDGVRHEGSVLIVDDRVRSWPVRTMAEVTPASLTTIAEAGPSVVELVLLGTGAVQALPPRVLRAALQSGGYGLEFMDTAAACKLYNYLASEGRRVAAALIAV